MPVTFANSAGQLINTTGLFEVPVSVPPFTVDTRNHWSMSFWMKANWGTSGVPRGRKSFVGIYGPVVVTPGLMGYYFNNMTLSTPYVAQRTDSTVNLNLGAASPIPGTINVDQFSVRWTGYFIPNVTGLHYFQTNTDDGVRLYVNNVLIIDQWNDHSATLHQGATNPSLTAGVAVPITLEWYENGGDAVCQLQYRTNTAAAYVTVPAWNGTFGLATTAKPSQTMTALQIGTATGAGELTAWTYGGAAMVSTPTNFMNTYNNVWVNIAYTFDGTTHTIYLNGDPVASSTTEQIPGMLQYITLNGYYSGGAAETDTHSVGNLIVYGRVLPASEVKTIATGTGNRHGDYYKCLARYEFNEGVDGTNVSSVLDLIGTSPTDSTVLLLTGSGTAPKYSYDGPADAHRQTPSRT